MKALPSVVEIGQGDDGLLRLGEEQAALRRVAIRAAEGASVSELAAAVTEEVADLLQVAMVTLDRYELDGSVVLASLNDPAFPVGSRWRHDGPSVGKTVFDTGRPARIANYSTLSSSSAAAIRASAVSTTVGVPVIVEGHVWGIICVGAHEGYSLPADTETRLARFTELLATAIANAEARDGLHSLANEQSALRRVATLAAEGTSGAELFSAVAEEIARVLNVPAVTLGRYESDASVVIASFNDPGFPIGSVWPHDEPSIGKTVFETGLPARIDDHSGLPGSAAARNREFGIHSIVGVPIVVDDTVWGVICAATTEPEPLPSDTEVRLGRFTELLGTAIANAEARDSVHRLADEQSALRRVATLVAEGTSTEELFAVVAEKVARLVGVPAVTLDRFETDGSASIVLGSWQDEGQKVRWSVGSRWPLDGPSVAKQVWETARPAKIEDYTGGSGAIASTYRDAPQARAIGVPIIVDAKVWGMIGVGSTRGEEIPADAEARLVGITELLATAIASAEARDSVRRLADEQAALRRVATLVAEGATGDVLFSAVAKEAAQFLGDAPITIDRYQPDGTTEVIATWGDGARAFQVGDRWPVEPDSLAAKVLETGAAGRIDDYSRRRGTIAAAMRTYGGASTVGVPIVVDGTVWGLICTGRSRSTPELPADAEARLTRFTELVATAISNSEAREDVRELLDEQAALRRVATLVAEGATARHLFSAVTDEVARLLGVPVVTLDRYEGDEATTVLAATYTGNEVMYDVGSRWPLDGPSVAATILETGRSARIDDYSNLTGTIAAVHADQPHVSSFGVPIVVDGKVWGMIGVGSSRSAPLPADTEARLTRFTELVATAVSNATARSELIASRARIVAAGDEARRRIERDLHDGTQQRLIAVGLDVEALLAKVPADESSLQAGLERVGHQIESVLEEVRELSHGLHPALLSRHGLGPSLRSLARLCPVPVTVRVDLPERPPPSVETGVYYVVSEALTNVAKHAQAAEASVTVEADGYWLHASIVDDGVGGAEPSEGSGLAGLVDRVVALGGRFALESPRGGGTQIAVSFTLEER